MLNGIDLGFGRSAAGGRRMAQFRKSAVRSHAPIAGEPPTGRLLF
jgi:hypothetical protein